MGKRLRLVFSEKVERKTEKIDQIFLWLILAGGFLSFLLYGLSYFLARPTVETITTHSSNANYDKTTEIKFRNDNSK
jgi:hypothetical protein